MDLGRMATRQFLKTALLANANDCQGVISIVGHIFVVIPPDHPS